MPTHLPGECCQLVGNFPGLDRCIISFSSRTSTEVSKAGGNLIIGATTGVISITAYATDRLHLGCPGRAGMSVPWLSKYDCDEDTMHYIYAGAGEAHVAGDVEGMASLNMFATSYRAVNASASSGPTTIYEDGTQDDGYGLTYTGPPWSFNSEDESTLKIDTGVGDYGVLLLQSFSLTMTPAEIPIASYEFIWNPSATTSEE